MAKLYPPYLEGTLPAFSLNDEGNGILTIPFAFNRAVNYHEVKSMRVKFKTVQNDALLVAVALEDANGRFKEMDTEGNSEISLKITNWKLYDSEDLFAFKIGQYYKIQISFVDLSGIEGYYSTVGVIKCTSDPTVSIIGFSENEINKNSTEFFGRFYQGENKDVTEKVYSSKFEIFYPNGQLAYTSGEMLHNVQNDAVHYASTDSFSFNREIPQDELYTIRYTVTTTNGLVKSSPLYYIAELRSYDTTVKGDLVATLNYDEGYVELSLQDDTGVEFSNGSYVLSREDSLDPGHWEELVKFSINNELVDSMILFKDFYIEQGKYYTYALQQYNENGLYTNRKKSNVIYADFEDIFLYDGTRQLKLRFNPQVSNFKTQLAETRAETIGSKYPFFFRNARIGYKVFPVSGLLSMLSDNNELFTSYEEIMRDSFLQCRHDNNGKEVYKHTDLLSKNILSERLFKLQVLDWLNNGKVKLFKSPSEGNYLVRLMDVSLSPENGLGRMLHNVSMTAYECDTLNRENFLKYGILKEIPKDEVKAQVHSIRETTLQNISFVNGHSKNLFNALGVGAYTTFLRFFDIKPGTKIELVFNKDGEFISENDVKDNTGIIITIGATGNYIVDDITPVYGIYIIDENNGNGDIFLGSNPTISYAGEDLYKNEFNLVSNITTYIGTTAQIVGEHEDILTNLEFIGSIDISKKEQVFFVDKIDIFKRPIKYAYYNGLEYIPTNNKIWGNIILNKSNENFGYNETLEDGLYLDFNLDYWERPFTHRNVLEYAPFGLFVVKPLSANGELFSDHVYRLDKNMNYTNDDEHNYDHLFEKYYIDRIILSTNAEEELVNTSLAYAALQKESNEEIQILLDSHPLFVIDGWSGNIYQVGHDFIYDPSFSYNEQNISLLELESYTLNKLAPENVDINLGNGVYANLYYQKTVTTYSLEEELIDLKDAKEELDRLMSQYKALTKWEDKKVSWREYENAYVDYIKKLNRAIAEYFRKE